MKVEVQSQLVRWGIVLMILLFAAQFVLILARPKPRYQLPAACTLLEIDQADITTLKFLCTGRIMHTEIER